jgi:UDP-N-acetylmuramate dehydrogenase
MAQSQSVARPAVVEGRCLKPYTTFKIGGPARFFAPVENRHDLASILDFAKSEGLPLFVLGGGSNVLISDTGVNAVVVHPANQGISLAREDTHNVWVTAEAGESWDGLVGYAADRNWWGIENLSHIPGQAGAALVQNIGAYGQQISDVLEGTQVAEMSTGEMRSLSADECGFAYRRSIFNTAQKGDYLILSLTLRLAKTAAPNLSYPDVKRWFEHSAGPAGGTAISASVGPEPGVTSVPAAGVVALRLEKAGNPHLSVQEVRRAITTIRDRKFPFPSEEVGGNAGSFFKNLILSQEEYAGLEQRIRDGFTTAELARLQEIRVRSSSDDEIKMPTAFLMEICGLKGREIGGARVNDRQPLVLLNRGGATARDVMRLAQMVRQTIFTRTGIVVPIEPELVGFERSELQEFLSL